MAQHDSVKGEVERLIKLSSVQVGKDALTNALNSLGYQVIEGMQTAVVENGRLIVKKSVQERYGVELQPIASSGRFQLRMVSGLSDSERNKNDDAAEEKTWCSDSVDIRDSLAIVGVELEIEKAIEPGATAVMHSRLMSDLMQRDQSVASSTRKVFDCD